jgi:hypothetical protein
MSDSDFWLVPVGIPWCREEDYDTFVAIFEDAKNLPPTWEGFANRAKEAQELYKSKGYPTLRVNINPRTFPVWCQSKGYRINAKARAQFAHDIVNAKA